MKNYTFLFFLIFYGTACVQKPSELTFQDVPLGEDGSGEVSDKIDTTNPFPGSGASTGNGTGQNNSGDVSGENVFFREAYKAMETSGCFNCHALGSQYGDFKKLQKEQDWLNAGLIVAGKPDESFLIKKMKLFNGPLSTMPPDNKLSQSSYGLMRSWISHVSTVSPGTSTTSGGGSSSGGTTSGGATSSGGSSGGSTTGGGINYLPPASNDEYKIQPQVMGIDHFVEQLKRLYFVNSPEDIVFTRISASWRGFWGGGCDFYESSVTSVKGASEIQWNNPTRVCDTKHFDGPTGQFSIIKEASRINACEYFANNQDSMQAFYEKGIIPDKTFNVDNARIVFNVFYPAGTMSNEIYNNFINKAKALYPAIANDHDLFWRLYLSTLCQSLYWEII